MVVSDKSDKGLFSYFFSFTKLENVIAFSCPILCARCDCTVGNGDMSFEHLCNLIRILSCISGQAYHVSFLKVPSGGSQ